MSSSETISGDPPLLSGEVRLLKFTVGLLPLDKRREVVVECEERINFVRTRKCRTCSLKAQPLPVAVDIVVSGDAEDAFFRHTGSVDQFIEEALHQAVLFGSTGERKITRGKNEVGCAILGSHASDRLSHRAQDNILRPLILWPHMDI